MVIINLGGYTLKSLKTPDIRYLIQREVHYLREAFHLTSLIWMDILQGACTFLPSIENEPLNLKRKQTKLCGA